MTTSLDDVLRAAASLPPAELLNLVRGLATGDKADLDRMLFGKKTPDYPEWLAQVSPGYTWTWPHLVYLFQKLARLTSGEVDRLAVFMPPRHGKTEGVTVRYPAWRIERDPRTRVIVGAHSQTLASKFSRKTRKIVKFRVKLSDERRAADDWETLEGGGLRAVGVGVGIAGHGADLILIDDPVRNAEEAQSEAYREKVWEWYCEDIYTRREPGAAMVLIQTRWHEDDLAGRILQSEDGPNWEVVNLPALAEAGDPLGRREGQALCPDRFDEAALADIARVMGLAFYALYQQRPTPREGNLLKRDWFKRLVAALPPGCIFARYWDKAGTDGDGCYSAGVLMARDLAGFYYVVDVVRGQWEYHEREAMIRLVAEVDRQRWGHVRTYFEVEGGSAGKDVAGLAMRNLAGFAVEPDHVTGSKEVRVLPFVAQAGAGNVRIYNGPRTDPAWFEPWVNELCLFPRGKFKDQVDATSGAFNRLADVAGPIIVGEARPEDLSVVHQAPAGVFGAAAEEALSFPTW